MKFHFAAAFYGQRFFAAVFGRVVWAGDWDLRVGPAPATSCGMDVVPVIRQPLRAYLNKAMHRSGEAGRFANGESFVATR